MTTIRGTVKDGQLVFSPEATAQLGLQEGEAVELPEAVIKAARASAQPGGNPFTAWIGALPPLPEGHDVLSFTRELRGGDEDDAALA